MNKNVTRGKGLLENFLSKTRAKMANKLIPDNLRAGRILDIGCGVTPFFLINTEFNQKYGLDPEINQTNENIILRRFDVEEAAHLPFNDNFFDVITMLAVFEHIELINLDNLLKEVKRILKPNGRFILTTPCPWSDKLLRIMAKLTLVSPEEVSEHKSAYSHQDLQNYLQEAGFKKEKMMFGYFGFFLNSWLYVEK